jgi:hypothetical protein
MSTNSITGIAVTSVKSLVVHLFKLSIIVFGWGLKLLGTICTTIAETIHKIILKRNQ